MQQDESSRNANEYTNIYVTQPILIPVRFGNTKKTLNRRTLKREMDRIEGRWTKHPMRETAKHHPLPAHDSIWSHCKHNIC